MADNEDTHEPSSIENAMMEALNQMEPDARNKEIENLFWRLRFEERLAGLTPEEYDHMSNTVLNKTQQQKLDGLTGKARDELADGYARTIVLIQCAWADYLKGVEPNKPFDASLNKAA